jgi:hypothetical protein
VSLLSRDEWLCVSEKDLLRTVSVTRQCGRLFAYKVTLYKSLGDTDMTPVKQGGWACWRGHATARGQTMLMLDQRQNVY